MPIIRQVINLKRVSIWVLQVIFRISRFFSIGLGAGFIQKGAQINVTKYWNASLQLFENVEGDIYWNQNFWTLEIPLTLLYSLRE